MNRRRHIRVRRLGIERLDLRRVLASVAGEVFADLNRSEAPKPDDVLAFPVTTEVDSGSHLARAVSQDGGHDPPTPVAIAGGSVATLAAADGPSLVVTPETEGLRVRQYSDATETWIDPTGTVLVGVDRIGEYRSDLGLLTGRRDDRWVAFDVDADFAAVQSVAANDGDNQPPNYVDTPPAFETSEDEPLVVGSPGVLAGVVDPDGDGFTSTLASDAANGSVQLSADGGFIYTPDDDFNGTDSFTIELTDDVDASGPHTIVINVLPVGDGPTSIEVDFQPVPENVGAGFIVGPININDIDGFNHQVVVDDPRFGFADGDIIVLSGPFDYETEPVIPLTISVTDNETDDTITLNTTVVVSDQNDPIEDLLLDDNQVFENRAGDVVGQITVVDPDGPQPYRFTVDDGRFLVDDFDLRLAPGVSVDYEAEAFIEIVVTATELVEDGGSFDKTFIVNVRDVFDTAGRISLTDNLITELVPGDVVGDIAIDGAAIGSDLTGSVDDGRFFVDGATLRLRDDVFIVRGGEPQILISVTVTDGGGAERSEDFVIDVLPNEFAAHNRDNPYDTDHDDDVDPLDALNILNYLRNYGPSAVGDGPLDGCYDVNGDGLITALDALLVLNFLRNGNGPAVGGEGEGSGSGGDGNPAGLDIAGGPAEGESVESETTVPSELSETRRFRIEFAFATRGSWWQSDGESLSTDADDPDASAVATSIDDRIDASI